MRDGHSSLAPEDDEAVRDDLAEKLSVSRSEIDRIRVLDWISGQVLVSFHSGRNPATTHLEPATPRDALSKIDQARRDCEVFRPWFRSTPKADRTT